jgi:hypothetical protein
MVPSSVRKRLRCAKVPVRRSLLLLEALGLALRRREICITTMKTAGEYCFNPSLKDLWHFFLSTQSTPIPERKLWDFPQAGS